MLIQTIESLEDQRWELRRMSLQVIIAFPIKIFLFETQGSNSLIF